MVVRRVTSLSRLETPVSVSVQPRPGCGSLFSLFRVCCLLHTTAFDRPTRTSPPLGPCMHTCRWIRSRVVDVVQLQMRDGCVSLKPISRPSLDGVRFACAAGTQLTRSLLSPCLTASVHCRLGFSSVHAERPPERLQLHAWGVSPCPVGLVQLVPAVQVHSFSRRIAAHPPA